MPNLDYKLVRDRENKPLIQIETPLGNGQEIYPDHLRNLAHELLKIADEAEQRDMGRYYLPLKKTTQY